jgi:oxygen-independent coproporphyrinogen-3 oxidase
VIDVPEDRSSWPFPALLPFHVKAYPIPQMLPRAGPRAPSAWPLPARPDLARWRERTARAGSAGNQIYVHVPFCPFFCDFCPLYKTKASSDRGAGARAAYLDALLGEIELYAKQPLLMQQPFRAVYLGGGTPTELTPGQIGRILAALRASFPLSPAAEITLEGVAGQFLPPGRLEAYADTGVNRISFGVQSLDPVLRGAIGRPDDGGDSRELAAAAKARRPGLCVNVDIMAGLPGQTLESFQRDIEELANWPIDSIDVITYIMFPGTGLHRRILQQQRRAPRYGGHLLRLRQTTARLLAAHGFRGVTADAYGRGADETAVSTALGGGGNGLNTVLGLGPSSWGLLGGTAYRNVCDLGRYVAALDARTFPVDRAARLSADVAQLRAQILGVALLSVPTAVVGGSRAERRFGRWQEHGLVEVAGDRWRVTEKGRFWCNQMQLDLLPARDHLRLVRMLGSPQDQEALLDDGPLKAVGEEVSRFVKGSGGTAGAARWLAYRGYLKLLKTPTFDARAVGWNGVTE